jgi:hypothetical protein
MHDPGWTPEVSNPRYAIGHHRWQPQLYRIAQHNTVTAHDGLMCTWVDLPRVTGCA